MHSLEIIPNYSFKCLTVLLSTQILILAMVPFSFISVSILCEFAMLADVYILLSPQEEDVHSSSWRDRCTHLAAHSPKRLVSLVNTLKENKTARQADKPFEVTQKFTFALNNFIVFWFVGKFTKTNFHTIFFYILAWEKQLTSSISKS